MARLFESYVMVDWSAASKPATGADSIWIGALTPDSRLKLSFKASNPPTRAKAMEELTELLTRCLKRGDRVLVGVDFPLGFPAGTSEALKLKGEPGKSLRDFLLKEMKDKPDNSNNRFALAARMNRLISDGPFPFWGCSKKDELTTLSVKKTREHGPKDIAEFRIVEDKALDAKKARPQPVWKIAYAGAIGGQAMTGIPAIERLREKFPALKVWPFDMPLAKLDAEGLTDTRVVVAEVLTTLNATNQQSSEIRDEAQVRSICEALAERDANGKLAAMFAGEAKLTDAQKAKVTSEEGWILGI
ncbi:MAG TPA: cobalamin biosynthesis protein CbiG [Hyphomonadaceae bacterium]|nr:cobalamin biosynthesis protein CbiG [Hyphomonadaceae bacterium]